MRCGGGLCARAQTSYQIKQSDLVVLSDDSAATQRNDHMHILTFFNAPWCARYSIEKKICTNDNRPTTARLCLLFFKYARILSISHRDDDLHIIFVQTHFFQANKKGYLFSRALLVGVMQCALGIYTQKEFK